MKARVFALTGGVGSGKSSVAAIFREAGVPVVDADEAARAALAPGSPGLEEVVRAFGPSILSADASLNRGALAEKVFSNAEERARLNAIVHPRVKERVQEEFRRLDEQGHAWICYDIPLLFETKQEDAYRPVVVVASTEQQQIERACTRDGITREAALARVTSQMPLDEKAVLADVLISNEGAKSELRERALAALEEVRKKW